MPEVIYMDYDNTIEDNSKWKEDMDYALKKNFTPEQLKPIDAIAVNHEKWDFIRKNYGEEYIHKLETDTNIAKMTHKDAHITGVDEFLETTLMSGIETHIVSQRHHQYVNKLLDRSNLRKYFKGVYGAGESLRKSRPEFTEFVLKEVNGKGKKCWMIGDASVDIDTALGLGCLAFVISDEQKISINKKYKDLINKQVFLVSYNSLSYILSTLVLG